MVSVSQPHSNDNPLWLGPCGDGWNGGITQSMLVRFMSCRERFRLRYVLGMAPPDKWNHRLGYGSMWHICEEAIAGGKDWDGPLDKHTNEMCARYPLQREELEKWREVCRVQFPEYVEFWSDHPDVMNRTPLLQERAFDVPYTLPSGRVVRLRGKQDSVDLITDEVTGPGGGVYLQENKTKGDVDKMQIERQLRYDLQTMLYLIALEEEARRGNMMEDWVYKTRDRGVRGVRYNVVRRPFAGGKGNISAHKAKSTSKGYTPAETWEALCERLRVDYIAKEPDYWFFRVRAEISARDMELFRTQTLDPLLEQLCWWYDEVTGKIDGKYVMSTQIPPMNYRTPFGVWSALEEGGSTEYDYYLETGSEGGLRRSDELFPELR